MLRLDFTCYQHIHVYRFEHIIPILRQLHWLPVLYRINFKIILLTFKALHGLSPRYLQDLITVGKESRYCLRSGNNGTFLAYSSSKMLSTLGDRAFPMAAPKLWNALPFIRIVNTDLPLLNVR